MIINSKCLIQLRFGKVRKNKKTLKLTNFHRYHNVPGLFLQLRYLENINDLEFQRELIDSITNNDDFKKI